MMVQVFVECGYDVIFDGIDNYLFLLFLIKQDIIGKDVDVVLGKVFIMVNKNVVLNDLCLFFVISGLWIGILVVICCGFGEIEVKELVGWMCDILVDLENEVLIVEVCEKVKVVCVRFFVYGK